MSKSLEDLEKQLKELEKKYPNRWGFDAANAFLHLHLRIARAAKSSSLANAIEHFKNAEGYQSCIGTFATGSGEGLASMLALYDIMAERAELEEQLARESSQLADKRHHLREALDIWKRIKSDPNLGELLPQRNIQHLEKQWDDLLKDAKDSS